MKHLHITIGIFAQLIIGFLLSSPTFATERDVNVNPTTIELTKQCIEKREFVSLSGKSTSADFYAYFRPYGIFSLNQKRAGHDQWSNSKWTVDAPGRVRVHDRTLMIGSELVSLKDMVYTLKDCNTLNSEWKSKGKPNLVFIAPVN